jgi:hypothetical protein
VLGPTTLAEPISAETASVATHFGAWQAIWCRPLWRCQSWRSRLASQLDRPCRRNPIWPCRLQPVSFRGEAR